MVSFEPRSWCRGSYSYLLSALLLWWAVLGTGQVVRRAQAPGQRLTRAQSLMQLLCICREPKM